MQNILTKLTNTLSTEIAHFRRLNHAAQALLSSYILDAVAFPLVSVFTAALIWNQQNGLLPLLLFNAGFFILLPIMFILNGQLLKKINIKYLFIAGIFTVILTRILLLLLPEINLTSIFILGLLEGIAGGLYWGNRNYFNVSLVTDEHRNYVAGMPGVFGTISGILLPVLAGWVIISVRDAKWQIDPYLLVIGAAIIILCFSAIVVRKLQLTNPDNTSYQLKIIASRQWNLTRMLSLTNNFKHGVMMFLPIVLILEFIGDEGDLGIIQSVSSLAIAILLYFISRNSAPNQRHSIIIISVFIFILGSFSLLISGFSALGIIIFILMHNLSSSLDFTMLEPVYSNQIELRTETNDYSDIVDLEIMTNVGRLLALMIVLVAQFFTSASGAIVIVVIAMIISQLFSWQVANKLLAARNAN